MCAYVVQGDICAAVNVDNHRIGQTDWKSPGNHAWDQVFKVDLEKVFLQTCTTVI